MDYGIRDFHGCRTYNAYLKWAPEENSPEPLLSMAKTIAAALPKTPAPSNFDF